MFSICAQSIDCWYTVKQHRQGSSKEYPQSIFWSKNKKNRKSPVNPKFYFIKVGFKGVYFSWTYFLDVILL